MKKLIIPILLLIGISAFSQEYKYGIGARVGSSNGLSIKGFVQARDDKYIALEAIGALRYGGYSFTGLIEMQKEWHIKGMRYAALYYYAGVGPHVGSYALGSSFKNRDDQYYLSGVLNVGADIAFGLEYVFADFPLSIGADIRPYYDFINPGRDYFDAGVSLRFAVK